MIASLIGPVTSLIDKVIPNKDEANRLAHEIATLAERQAHELAKQQSEINKTEAAHKSLFVAGWRPAVGWVCVLGMFLNYILIPIANFILALTDTPITVPNIDTLAMMPVLMGMLGLGTLRTYEKYKCVSREK
jgi:hypothetical protein